MLKIKTLLVAGARPNFMKIAPIYAEMKKHRKFIPVIVHTGQHYDKNMSRFFFRDLELPKPDIYLGVGSGSHAAQTAKIMMHFEEVFVNEKPDLVLVVGDVNSTLACSVVSAKLHIPVAHVEAGLRSFDRAMPEEINRIVCDSISDFLFTTCEDGNRNLIKEGHGKSKVFFVGNVMIDTLLKFKRKALKSDILGQLNIKRNEYAILTLHRPSNVDNKETFQEIINALKNISDKITIIFPIHPRTRKQIEKFKFFSFFDVVKCVEPVGYLDFLNLMINSRFALTDSGGIQEETTILDIPCLTLRENTERPITIKEGTNILVGTDEKRIVKEAKNILNGNYKTGRHPKFWDGKAAQRIVKILKEIMKFQFSAFIFVFLL
jgi:UDP-N-acetylglucosamine 2-epimerase (non-hydrolysing)